MTASSKAILRTGTELLAELDQVTRDASQTTTRVRVDRLLESAAPGVGLRYWRSASEVYFEEVRDGTASRDDVWEELFTGEQNEDCGCGYLDGIARECDTDLERANVCGVEVTWPAWESSHDADVLNDPDLGEFWMGLRANVRPWWADHGLSYMTSERLAPERGGAWFVYFDEETVWPDVPVTREVEWADVVTRVFQWGGLEVDNES